MPKTDSTKAEGAPAPTITERLLSACNGHPNAKIAWPHRLLHEAADRIAELEQQFSAYKNSPSHVGGYPRWLEDEIHQCRQSHGGSMCDSEDLCNEHRAKALATPEPSK